ncbi:unnamed protein product [Trichobilharzia szidati]|nr:unnamed protein product [Trichobilharzia szidati]
MLRPDELNAIQKLNEMFEKEEKSEKQVLQENHKSRHHHHHNHNHAPSSIFRCSETRTFDTPTLGDDSRLVPTGLPRIQTKIAVKILERDCCITVKLDPTAKLETVRAKFDLTEEVIIIGYQRLVTLKTLENLPVKLEAIIEQNENFDYDLTTYVEHKYKVSLDMYYLNSARVKQKKNVIYIMIPRKLKSNDITL